VSIHRAINAYYGSGGGEHHRYRSWEHCYSYFRQARPEGLIADPDHAALQLAFYLASWGMYRGSSFLLQCAYTVHRSVIELIAERRFDELWDADFGANEADGRFIPRICELTSAIKQAYRPFAPTTASTQPTDTLVTKVILGTFGCLPACDRYFIKGFTSVGFKYSCLDDDYVQRVLSFSREHLSEFREEQATIEQSGGIRYPLMKLVDMCFWQIGFEKDK